MHAWNILEEACGRWPCRGRESRAGAPRRRRTPAEVPAHPAIYTGTLSYHVHTQHTDIIWPHALTITLHTFIYQLHRVFDGCKAQVFI